MSLIWCRLIIGIPQVTGPPSYDAVTLINEAQPESSDSAEKGNSGGGVVWNCCNGGNKVSCALAPRGPDQQGCSNGDPQLPLSFGNGNPLALVRLVGGTIRKQQFPCMHKSVYPTLERRHVGKAHRIQCRRLPPASCRGRLSRISVPSVFPRCLYTRNLFPRTVITGSPLGGLSFGTSFPRCLFWMSLTRSSSGRLFPGVFIPTFFLANVRYCIHSRCRRRLPLRGIPSIR